MMNNTISQESTMSESLRLENVEINQYMKEEYEMLNEGYIDINKGSENTRILALNPRGLNLWDDQKMTMYVQSYKKYQIDIALLNEKNLKWNLATIDKIEYKCKEIGREVWIKGGDSKEWGVTNKNYLLGGVLTMVLGKSRALVQEDRVEYSPLGNWIVTHLEYNNKKLALINIYQIPASSQIGPYYSLTQYNLTDKKVKSLSEYRKEILI